MPPLVLTIEVDDKGSPVLRQFAQTAQEVGAQLGAGVQEGATRATGAINALTQSLGSTLKTAAGFALGFAGLSTLGSAFATVTSASNDFARALANANSLIPGQTALQQQLREEILRLPPALGASKDLAAGLYAVLSAGIKPTEAVGFLAVSANLAKAGLSTLDTATTAITKTLQVYGLQTSDATRVSEVLFETVNLGQGTLEQFAGALPNVLVPAKALGVSFNDVSASLAVLSNAFRSPSEAATGLRSLLSQLVANADEFALRGVNIREVITSKGLLGALDSLRTLTQGNAEAVRKFIPDIEGQQAALTLLGAQYEKFIVAQEQFGKSAGNVAKAVQEQNAPMAASFSQLGNAFLTYTSAALQGSSLLQSALKRTTEFFQAQTKATLDGADASRKLAEEEIRNRIAFEQDTAVVQDQAKQVDRLTTVKQDFAKALQREKELLAGVELSFKALKTSSQKELEDLAEGALLNFKRIRDAGIDPPDRVKDAWEKAKEAIIKAYNGLTPELQKVDEQIKANAATVPVTIEEAYKRFGANTTAELQRTAERSLEAFQKILADGKATPEQLLEIWQRILRQINEAGFKTLPPGFQAVYAQILAIAQKAGVELPKPFVDAFNQIQVKSREILPAFTLIDTAIKGLKAAAGDFTQDLSGNFGTAFQKAQIESNYQLGLITKATRDLKLALLDAGENGGKGLSEGIKKAAEESSTSLARFGAEVDILEAKFASINIPFATDADTLKKQLEQAKRDLADLIQFGAGGQFGPVGLLTQGFEDAIIREKKKLIDTLQQKIDELAGQSGSAAGTAAGSAGGTGSSGSSGGGESGGSLGGGNFAGSPRPGPNGLPLTPILSPAPFPFQGLPVSSPIPTVQYVPGPYTPSALPQTPPPTPSPGGNFTIPQVTGGGPGTIGGGGPGAPQFLSVPEPHVDTPTVGTTRGSININVNVSTMALTRNGAQDLAQHLAPALRELQRQGRI